MQGLKWHQNSHLLSLNGGPLPSYPGASRELFGMSGCLHEIRAPQCQLAKHLLTPLVSVHPVQIKQMTSNLQVRGVGVGGPLNHMGEIQNKSSMLKRARVTWV